MADSTGGLLPGADVVVKGNATSLETRAVTDETGRFTIPALPPGVYTVTVSLMGFKTVKLPDIQLVTATPTSVKVTLEVGMQQETVTVVGAAELVQTQTASVQTTLDVKQVQQLPFITRNAIDFVTLLPGVQTAASGIARSSIINGLPNVTINITLDGVNVQDNNNRNGDGFFTYMRTTTDSIEEITVSSSTPGAEAAGQGAVQMRFSTRGGSNNFSGAFYNSWRNQAGTNDADVLTRNQRPGFLWRLNTPYWFDQRDKPKTAAGDYFLNDVRLQQPGFRVGGPISIPGLFSGKDKAFFFFNFEAFLWPGTFARTRYLLNPQAQQGNFSYIDTKGVTHTVNVFDVANKYGYTSTPDPTVSRLLGDIRTAAANSGGGISAQDVNVDKLSYSPSGTQKRYFPTTRVDFNIKKNHRLTGTFRYNKYGSDVDALNSGEPRFPGFPNFGSQSSNRYSWTAALRSTLGAHLVNEARYGFAGGTTLFSTEYTVGQFNCQIAGCQSIDNNGWNLGIGTTLGTVSTTGATTGTAPSSRYVPSTVYEDTLTWLKGKHTISTGASFTRIYFKNWDNPGGVVPGVSFGFPSNSGGYPKDPAYSTFDYTNQTDFPGLTSTQAGYLRNFYALMTGRVTQVSGTAVLGADGKYKYEGDRYQQGAMNELGVFLQDSWRVKPNVTLAAGLRYELQLPFQPDTNSYARLQDWSMVYGISGPNGLFRPGATGGQAPVFVQYAAGDRAYNIDWNNFAPSIGMTWRPQIKNGILKAILSSEPVFRGGYAIAYTRYGTGDFTGIYGNNPGSTRTATRAITLGNFGTDGMPVLLRDTSRLYPTPGLFPDSPTFPFTPATNETVATMDPNLKVPYTHQYSFGVGREIGKSMGLEVRYVGNVLVGGWNRFQLNGSSNWNMVEATYGGNTWVNEFKKAQANLVANINAGKGATFAYTGVTGTSPLPIYLAFFLGLDSTAAADTTKYTGSNWTNTTQLNYLSIYNSNPAGPLSTSSGFNTPSLRANAAKVGIPANFFQANPTQYNANQYIEKNGGNTKFDSMQVDFRRRLTNGLMVQFGYVWSKTQDWQWPTLRNTWSYVPSTRSADHNFKFNWLYELPFGQGKKFGGGMGKFADLFAGGWEIDGGVRLQSGRVVSLGHYRFIDNGKLMTQDEVQKIFKLNIRNDANGIPRVYMFPQDFILQSIIALNNADPTSPTGWNGPAPTGRYMLPANGPDPVTGVNCVEAYSGQCAPLGYWVRGPWFGRLDMSFVKRVSVGRSRRIEFRMDLFNILNNINFNPDSFSYGTNEIGWQVTSAYTDSNGSQDPGGRVTTFSLRFTW